MPLPPQSSSSSAAARYVAPPTRPLYATRSSHNKHSSSTSSSSSSSIGVGSSSSSRWAATASSIAYDGYSEYAYDDDGNIRCALRDVYDTLQSTAPALLARATALLQPPSCTQAQSQQQQQQHEQPHDDVTAATTRVAWRSSSNSTTSSTSSCALPSVQLVYAAAAHLDALSAHYTTATAPAHDASNNGRTTTNNNNNSNRGGGDEDSRRCVAAEVTTLSRLLTWYCLHPSHVHSAQRTRHAHTQQPAAAAAAAVSSSRDSNNTAAMTTSTAAPDETTITTPPPSAVSPSSSSSSGAAVHDWLGSRMATTAAAAATEGHVSNNNDSSSASAAAADDAQLSTQLFHTAVRAVVRFSCFALPSTTTQRNSNSADNDDDDDGDEVVAMRVRASVLHLLAAVLTRFADCAFNGAMFIPLLFPPCDVRRHGPPSRHPLLTPLLLQPRNADRTTCRSNNDDNEEEDVCSVQAAAALALTALLRKLRAMLMYAEERAAHRSAFASMSTLSSELLLCVHEALHYCLADDDDGSTQWCGNGDSHRGSADATTATRRAQTRLLAVYASLVAVTPYTRCTHSLHVLLQTLRLPLLRQLLRGEVHNNGDKDNNESSMTTSAATASAVTAATEGAVTTAARHAALTLLVRATQREAVRPHFAALFDSGDVNNSSNNNNSSNSSGAGQPQQRHALHAHTAPDATACCLLSDLLPSSSSAPHDLAAQVEVWYCLVQLAQHTPRVLQRHFTRLLDASVLLLQQYVVQQQQQQQQQQSQQDEDKAAQQQQHTSRHCDAYDNKRSSVAAVSWRVRGSDKTHDMAAAVEALSLCLRAWLHYEGSVWLRFDEPAATTTTAATTSQQPPSHQQQQQQRRWCSPPHTHAVVVEDDDDDDDADDSDVHVADKDSSDTSHATLAQRAALHERLLLPIMQQQQQQQQQPLPWCNTSSVCYGVLRCLAQLGDAYVHTLDAHARDVLARYALTAAAQHSSARVRAEAVHTMGTWLWLYTAFDATHACVFVDAAVRALRRDADALVRSKAALALSNVTTRLALDTHHGSDAGDDDDVDERVQRQLLQLQLQQPCASVTTTTATRQQQQVAPLPLHMLQHQQQTLSSSHATAAATTMTAAAAADAGVSRLQLLCDVAMYAASAADGGNGNRCSDTTTATTTDAAIRSHGVRMMRYLLRVLGYDELIAELTEHEEGVAEAFLRTLTAQLRNSNNNNNNNSGSGAAAQTYNSSLVAAQGKLRWNAAGALGDALAREVVYEAEPVCALAAVRALCEAVVQDKTHKVRTQAARALARVPASCVARRYSDEDLTPCIVHALCGALARCCSSNTNSSNGNNSSNSAGRLTRTTATTTTTTTTAMTSSTCVRRDRAEAQATLCAALREAVSAWLTKALPSAALTTAYSSYGHCAAVTMWSRIANTLDVLWSVGHRLRTVYNASKSEQTRSRDRQRTAVRVAAFVTCALLLVALDGREDALAELYAALRLPLRTSSPSPPPPSMHA